MCTENFCKGRLEKRALTELHSLETTETNPWVLISVFHIGPGNPSS